MNRREQLMAALAQGDASHPELLARLPAEQNWTAPILRVHLSGAIKAGVVWVCELGNQRPEKPRRYTCEKSRAVKVRKVRKVAEIAKPSRPPSVRLVAKAISNRSQLELAWAGHGGSI